MYWNTIISFRFQSASGVLKPIKYAVARIKNLERIGLATFSRYVMTAMVWAAKELKSLITAQMHSNTNRRIRRS